MIGWRTVLAASLTLGGLTTTLMAQDTLIDREVLFGNPERVQVRLSPDGAHLSFIAPVDGVLNVWAGPADDWHQAKPITNDTHRGIRSHFWAWDSNHIIYTQDKGGDENFHAYSVDLTTGEELDLTPGEKLRAQIQQVSPDFPGEILIGVNDRDPRLHDLYRVNLSTGERELVMTNTGYVGFVTDDSYTVRFAQRFRRDGGIDIYQVHEGQVDPEPWQVIPESDAATTNIGGFDREGKHVYLLDSRPADTAGLYRVDVETKDSELIYRNPKADVSGLMVQPTTYKIEAVSSTYERTHWEFFDDAVKADFAVLGRLNDAEVSVSSRTKDDRTWIVSFLDDDGPVKYYKYDRDSKNAEYLFSHRPELEGLPLAPMHPVVVKARDGLEMVCYLTLPRWTDEDGDARPNEPLPMVLNVHGGPWARDNWGYNPTHQWLANRGYAVLSVNYRGSTGFGKEFINASNYQWAGTMHDDLIDAVDWAIAQGIADPDRVGIMGGSYGGYATLVGLTFTPDRFAAGVDIVGPSNLITLLNSIPPYWEPALQLFKSRVGDKDTPEGRRALRMVSPLTHVDEIKSPLLIGQGANDPRVKQQEADQIVDAMTKRNIPVTYVLFPDEGHGFARPENRLAFNAVTEAFLAEHLGGRYEPIDNDLEGSSITVPAGADEVPGVAEHLSAAKPADE